MKRSFNGWTRCFLAGSLIFLAACGSGGSGDSETVPTAPSDLACTATAADTVQLTWLDNSGNETGFHVYKLPDRTTPVKSVSAGITGTIITGLQPEWNYQFEVTAYNMAGESGFSNTASDTTPAPPVPVPAAPSDLAVIAVSSSEAGLTWTDNSDDEDSFRIYRGATSITVNSLVDSVSADSTLYIDTTISSGQPYYYKVVAHNTGGESIASSVVTVTTHSPEGRWEFELGAYSNCSPYGPRSYGLIGWGMLTEPSPGQLLLSSDQGDFTGYYAPQGGEFLVIFNGYMGGIVFQPLILRAPLDLSYIHSATGAIQDSGCGGVVTDGSFAWIDPGAPEAPSDLEATALTSSIIELSWTDNAANEQGYRIYRGTYFWGIDNLVATVGPGVENYTDTNLPVNTSYGYRVVAYNAVGESPRSNHAGARTFQEPAVPPGIPSNLSATPTSGSTVSLSWTDTSGDEDGFKVYRGTSSASISSLVATLGVNVTEYLDPGLSEGVTYYYQVTSYNSAGESARSAWDSAQTLSSTPVPDAPSNLTATTLSGTQVRLAWNDNSSNETGFTIFRRSGSCEGTFFGLDSAAAGATSKTVSGLSVGTTYCFKVAAFNAAGNSSYSNTVSAVTEIPPTTLRIVNNTHYDMIDVRIDGNQQYIYPDLTLPEGGWREWTGSPGTYALDIGVGRYLPDQNKEIWFTYEGSAVLSVGETEILTVENPTVGQLLTNFQSYRDWSGSWWCGTSFRYMGYRIHNNNTWDYYVDGVYQSSGTITNVDWPTYALSISFNMNGPVTLYYPFGVINKSESTGSYCSGLPTYSVSYTPD